MTTSRPSTKRVEINIAEKNYTELRAVWTSLDLYPPYPKSLNGFLKRWKEIITKLIIADNKYYFDNRHMSASDDVNTNGAPIGAKLLPQIQDIITINDLSIDKSSDDNESSSEFSDAESSEYEGSFIDDESSEHYSDDYTQDLFNDTPPRKKVLRKLADKEEDSDDTIWGKITRSFDEDEEDAKDQPPQKRLKKFVLPLRSISGNIPIPEDVSIQIENNVQCQKCTKLNSEITLLKERLQALEQQNDEQTTFIREKLQY